MEMEKFKGKVTVEQAETVRRIGAGLVVAMEALTARGIPLGFTVEVVLGALGIFAEDIGGREAFMRITADMLDAVDRADQLRRGIESAMRTPPSEKS